MDPLDVWQKEIQDIKPAKKNLTKELADKIDQRVTGKMVLSMLGGPPAQFTWKKEIFVQLIENLPPSNDTVAGITMYCNAWEAATMASVLTVTPGAFIGAPAPPTLFSVVASTVLMPPSIAAGKKIIFDLLSSAVPVKNPKESKLAQAMFSAFSSLQGQVTGLDSTPTPAGPLPLTVVSPVV